MADDESFCTQCGTPAVKEKDTIIQGQQEQAQPIYYNVAPPSDMGFSGNAEPAYRTEKPKNKKKRLAVTFIIAGCVLALAAGIAVPVLMEKDRAERYEAAVVIENSGDLVAAKAAFLAMGEYKDSADMAQECQNKIDYNAAKVKMDAGDYEQARDAFVALGEFGDSKAMAEHCRNIIDYNAAKAFMDAGDNAKAMDAFSKLGSFQNSAKLATECKNRLDYDAANKLLADKNYVDAMRAYKKLGGYSDAADKAIECQQNIDYIAADQSYKSGFFYTAYSMFSTLGKYGDAEARAKKCIQSAPKSAELYHNPNFAKKLSLTIKNKGKSVGLCARIYSDDNDLVSFVYVAPGKKVKIKLQKGDYTVKLGWGAKWFGTKEYFGEDAFYGWGNDAMSFTISSGYYYTYDITTPGSNDIEPGVMTYQEF